RSLSPRRSRRSWSGAARRAWGGSSLPCDRVRAASEDESRDRPADDDRDEQREDEIHEISPQVRESERPARRIENDRDVVLAAARLREVDEGARGAAEILAPNRRSDVGVGHVAGQSVRAEQKTVARAKCLDEDIG